MGPNDPFRRPPPAAPPNDRATQSILPATAPERTSQPRSLVVLAGFGAGLVFGILVLVFGFGGALLVLLLGALGGALSWLGYGVTTGHLDPAAAWRALRRG